ncbi:phosphatase PAP2 family protein [Parvicella tangerina]|uniref:Phosphatidic acid phosphatase type 2/haloperoxidase domain-containing protein n=1 Tax=Parvicella tangerina TaxID=2829795 RepID=A0A916JNI2_9FLAO|nr:phosphatase PAP2 family protein [Parvicella tangerina]CAG5083855.1 hypothetical protein CRYO30217_02311 [Parvicella tangerina]
MKSAALTIIGIMLIWSGIAQSPMPFQLTAKKEAWVTGSALPVVATSFVLGKKLQPLTAAEISLLDANDINRLDRFTVNNFSEKVIKRSDITLNTMLGLGLASNFIVPAIFSSSDPYGRQLGTLGMIWFETNLVNYALTEIVKTSVKRSRPFLFGDQAPDELRFGTDARKSFFSGHASFTAANSFYVANIITSYQKGNKWNPVIWGAASLPPLLVAFQRVRAGKHFPTDVAVGYIVGAACGILIPKLHEVQLSVKSTSQVGGQKTHGMKLSVNLLNVKMVF